MKSVLEDLSQQDLFEQVGDICSTVSEVISTSSLLEISLKKTIKLFGATRGSIFILKGNGKDLILQAASGMKSTEKDQLVKQMGEGIVGRVAKLKQPLFVDDIASDERFKDFKQRGSYSTPSFICAPLMVKDTLIGVINISDKKTGKRFSESDLQLLDFITTQIALNYKRIELYQKFKSILKEKKNLKVKLGRTTQEKKNLRKQVDIHERLATIGKLAGGVAHEFNNPLDGVMRYTNLSLDNIGEDNEVVRGYLLEIKHGLNRMANIVKNLLACSREERPINHLVYFSEALKAALQNKDSEIVRKNISLSIQVEKELPAICDFGLEQILTNIIGNAIDAMEKDGKITISAKAENSALIIKIADTGCGISEEKIDKIFEPFFTTKDIDKGCGLGLTIVCEIVKTYDGKIDIESELGKGTVFIISLPL